MLSSEETLRHAINYIFDVAMVKKDIGYIGNMADLNGKTILDSGCGWGGVAYQINKNFTCDIHCVDYVYEHALFTKLILPDADVWQCDARDTPMFADSSFDVVVSRGVIEHVGDHSVPRGKSGDNLPHQAQYVREMARILKNDGYMWLNTGNYSFPFDGEISQWFFHWMPEYAQKEYLNTAHESPDMYFLLTWPQLHEIFNAASLSVANVMCSDIDTWREPIYKLCETRGRNSKEISDVILKLISQDPQFMSSWNVTLKKQRHQGDKIHSLHSEVPAMFSKLSFLHKIISRKSFVERQSVEIRQSGEFDYAWYLSQYPDVRAAGTDPVIHYVSSGWKEGKDPSPYFSTRYYLAHNHDAAECGICPLWHKINSNY
jgi:ubiquinone/menaquinone biosynthesis C-methylase UbiE